ncbi:hypothetical protein ACFL5C_01660 [Candidatus Omnitrophota bacterium]
MRKLFLVSVLIGCILLTFCTANAQGAASSEGFRKPTKDVFKETEEVLKDEDFDKIHKFLARNYFKGSGETQDRIEADWQKQQLIDLDFTINRILRNDGLLNVQVTWRKTFLDAQGAMGKQSGTSEIILKPTPKGAYKILDVKGDQFF